MMGVEAAVEPLRGMLLNGEGVDITVAANALGRIGSPAAADALLTALADRGVTSRRHAALAALEAMGESAVGPVSEMLVSRDAYARRNAAQALGWIGSPSATPVLVATLRDKNAAVRQQAAWSLGEIGDSAAWAALERVQERDDTPAVRSAAAAALTRIEAQPATVSHWPSTWASALNRLQTVRWSILAALLLSAAWLAMGNARLSPALIVQRVMRPQ
jgi:HEAT repeat protein